MSPEYNAAIDRMAQIMRAWLETAPEGADLDTDVALDAAVESAVPGFSGGMWEAAALRARTAHWVEPL